MSITVRQLVGIPDLKTWIHAGGAGAEREIKWAHVSELPDPTEWLDSGELLMTTGLAIPEEPTEQRAYVERLSDADLSGLLVGDGMHAPELSAELTSAAGERSLPVLLTAYEVPFTAIGRAVADANAGERRERLARTQRVYDVVRSTAGTISGTDLMKRLSKVVGCELYVLDPDRGSPLLPGSPPAPESVIEELTAVTSRRANPVPALLRLRDSFPEAMVLAVPASRPAAMIVLPQEGEEPDLSILRHVTAVAALEIEKERGERERRRRLGSELLAGLIDNRVPSESAEQSLAERNLGKEPRALAVCYIDEEKDWHPDLHLKLEDHSLWHLLLRRAPFLAVLLPDTPEAIDGLRKEIGTSVAIGLSGRLSRASRTSEAHREARWALHEARAVGGGLVRYAQGTSQTPFLPRSLGEAERIVQQVLGDIIDYDATHGTCLVQSLHTFLYRNRSWKEAAGALHVHKQTLVYRIRRIEEISARRLDRTQDVAEFWLALKAAEASEMLESV